MREKIYNIIEVNQSDNLSSRIYDIFMMVTIVISIIPLAFKEQYLIFVLIDKVTAIIYIIDYLLRFITADYRRPDSKTKAFLLYPFTPMAIIDFLAILPTVILLNNSFKLLKIVRLLRSFRIFRVFKVIRYSKSINMIINIFKRQKDILLTVLGIAVLYILISALIILNVEPQSFDNYFEAVYWATVSLTTMGYGDIYPTSTAGRIITMLSSILGIAIIALPASIITAGLMDELNQQ